MTASHLSFSAMSSCLECNSSCFNAVLLLKEQGIPGGFGKTQRSIDIIENMELHDFFVGGGGGKDI